MLSCREASRLVSEGLDHKLPWAKRVSLRLHLLMCRGCARFRRQIEGLDRLMRGRSDTVELVEPDTKLPSAVRERIKAAARDADQ